MARPRTAPNRLQICLDDDQAKQVEAFRFDRRFDSQSAALRELVVLGLEAAAQAKGRRRTVGYSATAALTGPAKVAPMIEVRRRRATR
jgi:hypothetical protein